MSINTKHNENYWNFKSCLPGKQVVLLSSDYLRIC